MDPRPLSVAVLLFGLLVYIGAVSGALFKAATQATDVGALSLLLVSVLFGVLGFLLIGRSKVPA